MPTLASLSAAGSVADADLLYAEQSGVGVKMTAAQLKTHAQAGVLLDTALDTDGTLAANSDAKVATQKATKTYVDQIVAAQDAMVFKGVIDCSANPNYPAADRGWTYRVSVAGKIGGGSGVNVEVGDILICLTDGTASGNQATVGAAWAVIQANLDGINTAAYLASDTDTSLAANSDSRIATQKAVKAYVDAAAAGATGTYTDEKARDAIGTALTAGSGISVSVDDPGDTITIASTITQYTDEMARDALGAALTAGAGITITPNDGADTIAIASSITQYTDEAARDAIGAALVAGTNITITVNDGADTITIDGVSTEAVQDIVGALLAAGTGVTVTYNDAGNVETVAVNFASAGETSSGTEAAKAVTPDGLAGSNFGRRVVEIPCTDPAGSAITVGDGQGYFVVTPEFNGMNLVDAQAAVVGAQSTSGLPTVQIANVTDAVDMLSTKITIDANETTSYTAATPSVIDAAHDDVATGDVLRVDLDVAGTGAKGLIVILTFQLS